MFFKMGWKKPDRLSKSAINTNQYPQPRKTWSFKRPQKKHDRLRNVVGLDKLEQEKHDRLSPNDHQKLVGIVYG